MRNVITATLLTLSLAAGLALPGRAQAPAQAAPAGTGQAFTLRQAVQYGLANSPLIRNAQADVESAKAQVGITRATGLPQINASVGYNYNIAVQKFVLEYGSGFSFGAATPQSLNGRPFGLGLALPNAINAGVTISQLLFSGSYIVALKASGTYKELSNKQLTQSRINLEANITRAYYQALVGREQIGLLNENISRLDSNIREVSILFKNGFAEKIDVDRLEVARNNLAAERESAARSIDLALAALKFQMNYPSDQPLTLVESLQNAVVDAAVPSVSKEYNQRIEYSILNTQEALALLDIKNKKAGYLPTLSAFGNFGYTSGASKLSGFFEKNKWEQNADVQADAPSNSVFKDTSGNNVGNLLQRNTVNAPFSGQRWYNYAIVGLTLNVPIFDGGSKHFQIAQANQNLKKVRNGKELVRNQIDLENQSALVSLRNALARLDIQKRNLALAEEVARVTRVKVKNGVGSNLEVVTAESDLREAQTNYYTSVYDVLVAKLDLELAGGRVSGN